jgi:hypothetical protein
MSNPKRVRELESVLLAVQQQFKQITRRGDNFPDGFDSRVYRWVDDAMAGLRSPSMSNPIRVREEAIARADFRQTNVEPVEFEKPICQPQPLLFLVTVVDCLKPGQRKRIVHKYVVAATDHKEACDAFRTAYPGHVELSHEVSIAPCDSNVHRVG